MPPPQLAQSGELWGEYLAAAQAVQLTASTAEYRPASHLWQPESPPELYFPAAQPTKEAAPVVGQ